MKVNSNYRVCFKDEPIDFFDTYKQALFFVHNELDVVKVEDAWHFYTQEDIDKENGPSVEINDLTD